MDIETTLRAMGVTWLRTIRSYGVATMAATLKEALRSAERGLKVIIADGECQLVRQRRVRAEDARSSRAASASCARASASTTRSAPATIPASACRAVRSLTVKPNPDPLRSDPVATVVESCVGCGLCGEVAQAAVLCPSFYRAEVMRNAGRFERMRYALRRRITAYLGASKSGGKGERHDATIRVRTPS